MPNKKVQTEVMMQKTILEPHHLPIQGDLLKSYLSNSWHQLRAMEGKHELVMHSC